MDLIINVTILHAQLTNVQSISKLVIKLLNARQMVKQSTILIIMMEI